MRQKLIPQIMLNKLTRYIMNLGNLSLAKRYAIGPINIVNNNMILTNNAKLAINFHLHDYSTHLLLHIHQYMKILSRHTESNPQTHLHHLSLIHLHPLLR